MRTSSGTIRPVTAGSGGGPAARSRTARAGVSALVVLLLTTGCGGGGEHHRGHGEATGPAGAGSPAAGERHNEADVAFARDMIPHHRQAVEMATLAETRAADSEVRALAARIRQAQDPEIQQLNRLLAGWGVASAAPSPGTHGHNGVHGAPGDDGGPGDSGAQGAPGDDGDSGGQADDDGHGSTSGRPGEPAMPGMMGEREMAALRAAQGPEFDRMFLQMMIDHHRGAVEMAAGQRRQGDSPAAKELAAKIERDQTDEIAKMRTLLERK